MPCVILSSSSIVIPIIGNIYDPFTHIIQEHKEKTLNSIY